jgi:hypothetical protein
MNGSLGQVVFAYFEDHLKLQKGLRPGSIRSYRDTIKLFLIHVAASCSRPVTRLTLTDLAFQRVLDFLRTIEEQRGNQPRTRNQRSLPYARSTVTSLFIIQKCWPRPSEWKPFQPNGSTLRKQSTWNAMRSLRSFQRR